MELKRTSTEEEIMEYFNQGFECYEKGVRFPYDVRDFYQIVFSKVNSLTRGIRSNFLEGTDYVESSNNLMMSPRAVAIYLLKREDRYLIKVGNHLLQKINQAKILTFDDLPDFANPAEAARAWADQFEANKVQITIKQDKEEVRISDHYFKDMGFMTMSDAVEFIEGSTKNKIYKYLRDFKVFNEANVPNDQYIDNGMFKILLKYTSGKQKTLFATVLISEKGIDFIRGLFTDD